MRFRPGTNWTLAGPESKAGGCQDWQVSGPERGVLLRDANYETAEALEDRQSEELCPLTLPHPGYDASLPSPTKFVLCTTGYLFGISSMPKAAFYGISM